MTYAELRTRSAYNSMSRTEKRVADYFLENIDSVYTLSISELAKKSGVTQVTWVRFCKAIGFAGLKELRKSLFSDFNSPLPTSHGGHLFSDLDQNATIPDIANTVKSSTLQAVEDTFRLLDLSTAETVVELIIKAKSVSLFGVGASGLVAEDLNSKFLRIGKNVRFCRDVHIQLSYAASLKKGDVAIFFSNSGNTREMLECLEMMKRSGCHTVAVTQLSNNPLSRVTDYVLSISSPEAFLRSGAMSSRIAELVVVDLLFTAVAGRSYSQLEETLEKSFESVRSHKIEE